MDYKPENSKIIDGESFYGFISEYSKVKYKEIYHEILNTDKNPKPLNLGLINKGNIIYITGRDDGKHIWKVTVIRKGKKRKSMKVINNDKKIWFEQSPHLGIVKTEDSEQTYSKNILSKEGSIESYFIVPDSLLCKVHGIGTETLHFDI
jgi:hypothetical protein